MKEIDSIKLDASIKKGVLLVQKSYDGRTWVNAAPPVVNYFATIKAGNNQFYTADGSDIASGTFYRMSVSYNRLWKLMIDKRISKTELTHMAGISTNAMAKLGRDEDVRMVVLEKICAALNCKIEDIVEIQNGDRLILEEQREIR